MLGINEVPFT